MTESFEEEFCAKIANKVNYNWKALEDIDEGCAVVNIKSKNTIIVIDGYSVEYNRT